MTSRTLLVAFWNRTRDIGAGEDPCRLHLIDGDGMLVENERVIVVARHRPYCPGIAIEVMLDLSARCLKPRRIDRARHANPGLGDLTAAARRDVERQKKLFLAHATLGTDYGAMPRGQQDAR